MAGQYDWKDAGSPTNAYIVKEEVARGVYIPALKASVWGRMNKLRDFEPIEIVAGGGTKVVGSGKDSPVHEKSLKENNTALFTMIEEYRGMPTFGDADVRPGSFPEFKHGRIEARTVSSPGFPSYAFESTDNLRRVMTPEQHIASIRSQLAKWMGRQFDIDGFNAVLNGLSTNLFDNERGGKGTQLEGTTTTVRRRVPLHTFVAGQTGMTAQSWSAETHNNNLATALAAMPAGSAAEFNYASHRFLSDRIDRLGIRPVKIDGQEFRAIALIDMANIYSLRRDPELVNLWRTATKRDDKNFALYSRDFIILDDILYLPIQIMEWFRPTVTPGAASGNRIRFGCDMDQDPRGEDFVNASTITMTIVLGAGALRRGRRFTELKYTRETGRHGKGGEEFAVHWDDGWMRADWYTQDGRQQMFNDTSFVMFNRDTGVI